jgi:hypothetical protein
MKRLFAVMIVVVAACGGGTKTPPPVAEEPPSGGRVMAPKPGETRVQAEITDVQPNSLGTMVTIGAGSADGVADGWTGTIMDAADRPLGDLQIVHVSESASIGKTSLSVDEIPRDGQVLLSPP